MDNKMENNYKEFIQKIKYMTEYDTSKTREENELITEDVEEVKEVIAEGIITEEDTPKESKGEMALNENVSDSEYTITFNFAGKAGPARDDFYKSLEQFKEFLSKEGINFEQKQTKYIDLEKNVSIKKVVAGLKGMGLSYYNDFYVDKNDSRLNVRDIEDIEDVSDRERGIRMAQSVVDNIRAKHKNNKNWDEFIGGFVERINDAFNVNEGEELNEAANTDLELKKAARDVFSIIKSHGFPVKMVNSSREFESKVNKENRLDIPVYIWMNEDGEDGSGYITIGIYEETLWKMTDKSINELDVDYGSFAAQQDRIDRAIPQMMNKLKELDRDIVSKLGNEDFEYHYPKGKNKYGFYLMQIRKKQ